MFRPRAGFGFICAVCCFALLSAAFATATSPVFAQGIGNGTRTETIAGVACRVRSSEQTGPIILVVGNRIGDAQAAKPGAPLHSADEYAIEQIGGWNVTRGKLVLLPAPQTGGFSSTDAQDVIDAAKPDWIVDLRDDKNATVARLQIVVGTQAPADARAEARKLQIKFAPPTQKRSSKTDKTKSDAPAVEMLDVWAQAGARLGRPVVVVTSAGKGLHPAPSVRTRFFRRAVAQLLSDLNVVDGNVENALVPAQLPNGTIRVAMYDSDGAAGLGPGMMETSLTAQSDVILRRVCATDVQTGALNQFDVLINPGGSSAKQGRNLADTGRAEVQKFIAGGGGYLGICAGCYLASSGYKWSLGLVDADIADKTHSNRGRAMLQMELTPKGRQIFGNLPQSVLTVIYHNGPVLAPVGSRTDSAFEPLAIYRTEIKEKKGKKNVMVGSAAIAADRYGKGRVIGISPHPEQTPGLGEMVPRAIRYLAAGRAQASRAPQ